jgi:hypothetical protein
MPTTLEAPKPAAAPPAPALALHELHVGPTHDGRQTLLQVRLVMSATQLFDGIVRQARREALAALHQAKKQFLAEHPAMAEIKRFESGLADAQRRLATAQLEEKTALAAADAAVRALDLDASDQQQRAADKAHRKAETLAGSVKTLEGMVGRAKQTARETLADTIHDQAKALEAAAKERWDRTAAEVLAAVPLALIERLFAAGQALAYLRDGKQWMPASENGNLWELPAT